MIDETNETQETTAAPEMAATPTTESTSAVAHASAPSQPAGDTTKGRKVRMGKVVSNKADKTIVVRIEHQVAHPIYKRYFKQSKKIMAHDEKNECNIGDTVRVIESRPLSARKRWTLLEVVDRAK
ncbi:MAG: hypothetical protein OKBPIBMD_01085 [Chlorobi bacterium]|nr:MAG: 30S ribosomal protein S17 [Chlorobi bacterium OLB6]MBV6463648.1 hypothetical protein [Chlorobiota bacterium]